MICPDCNSENRAGRRFCAACGQPLPVPCPACGFENSAKDRFCGGCGRELTEARQRPPSPPGDHSPPAQPQGASPETPLGEIRPVTVMFVDISGYTALSGQLDPEDTHRLLAQFFETVDAVVVRFGGRIDKHIGDSVMALFGAPVAHGNDPERAVLAAVAVHEAMPALALRIGHPLKVHIGIATGEVVASGLGSSAHSAYTVIGDAVNLAARLMEQAGPSETLVSAAIRQAADHAATAGGLAMEGLGPIAFKGIAAPVETFRIGARGKDGVPIAGAARTGTRPLVGRRAELAQMSALIDTTLETGTGGAIVLRGEPGIGKSRLADELHALAGRRGFHTLKALVLDFGTARERSVERVVAGGLLGAITGEALTLEPQALEAALECDGIDGADRPYLRDLLDLPQPESARATYEAMSNASRNRGKSEVLARLAAKMAAGRPGFLLIEDVHWADPAVLGHLAALVEVAGHHRLMLTFTTRIEGDPFDADFRAGLRRGRLTVIDLTPLGAEDAETMAHGLRVEFDDFTRRCITRAEGNPLFLEQLLRGVAGPERLPESLQSVVLARLDQLPQADRHALQAASVLGQRFEIADLAALINQRDYDPAQLLRRHLVRPELTGLLFAHALIRDGAYASLTRERRVALHQSAAALFQDRDAALHAEHLDCAEDPAAALAYLAAANAEAAAYRVDRALALAERGLAVAAAPRDRVALGIAAGRLGLDIGLAKAARRAFAFAAEAEEPRDRCRGLIGLAAADRLLADLPQALASLSVAEPIATALDDPALFAEICYLRGNLKFAQGRGDDCLVEHRRALAAAKRAGAPEWKARARSGLGDAYYMQGRIASSGREFLRTVEIARASGLLRIVPANQAMAAYALLYDMRPDEALVLIDQARQLAIELGDRFGEMFALQTRSFAHMISGRWSAFEQPARDAMERARLLGARRYEAFLLATLALWRHRQTAGEEATSMARQAMDIAEGSGLGFCGAMICGILALVEPEPARQQAAIARGEGLLRESGLSHNHIWFRVFAIERGLASRDWPLAERQIGDLAQYTAAEPLPLIEQMIKRARVLVRLGRDPADAASAGELRRLTKEAAERGVFLDARQSTPS